MRWPPNEYFSLQQDFRLILHATMLGQNENTFKNTFIFLLSASRNYHFGHYLFCFLRHLTVSPGLAEVTLQPQPPEQLGIQALLARASLFNILSHSQIHPSSFFSRQNLVVDGLWHIPNSSNHILHIYIYSIFIS